MKRRISVLSAMLLALAALTASVSAAALPDRTIDVKARYEADASKQTVYSVDVTWGEMQFVCNETGTQVWNPEDHSYTGTSALRWTAQGNTVTVVNHSNAPVTAEFRFAPLAGFTGLQGSFDVTSHRLQAGQVGGYATADRVTAELSLSGSLDQAATEFTKVGEITVQIH